jgi:hypothetical protein
MQETVLSSNAGNCRKNYDPPTGRHVDISILLAALDAIVVVGRLFNQSCQHIAHARIRRQAQGRSLAFHSVGYNIGCHSPPSNCNRCAHIDFSSCHPLGDPFSFTVQKIVLVTYSSACSGGMILALAKTSQ